MDWTSEISSLTTAGIGLLGVIVGGYITNRNQKIERQRQRTASQLAEFYSPMLALRGYVLAQSELRIRISAVSNAAWQELIYNTLSEMGRGHLRQVRSEQIPVFSKIIDENNRQAAEDIIPHYQKMIDLFMAKMNFAELATIEHFPALVEFVAIWERWLNNSLPDDVIAGLGHSEEKLYPFYKNIAANQARMHELLAEKCRWLWWKTPIAVRSCADEMTG